MSWLAEAAFTCMDNVMVAEGRHIIANGSPVWLRSDIDYSCCDFVTRNSRYSCVCLDDRLQVKSKYITAALTHDRAPGIEHWRDKLRAVDSPFVIRSPGNHFAAVYQAAVSISGSPWEAQGQRKGNVFDCPVFVVMKRTPERNRCA